MSWGGGCYSDSGLNSDTHCVSSFFLFTLSLFTSFSSLLSENTLCSYSDPPVSAVLLIYVLPLSLAAKWGLVKWQSWCCLCGQYSGSSFRFCLLSLEVHSSPPRDELEGCREGIWKQHITTADSRPPLSWQRDRELSRIITFFVVKCHICAAPILVWSKM